MRLDFGTLGVLISFSVSFLHPQTLAESQANPQRKITLKNQERNRRNGILFARVAVNEDPRLLRSVKDGGTDGLPNADAWALLQEIVEFARWKKVSFRRSLHWQMPRITGLKPPLKNHNQVWTSQLPATGRLKPSAWVNCSSVAPGIKCHGEWKKYAKHWEKFRKWSVTTITGGKFYATCDGHPITWGFQEDDHIAIRRNLCVLVDCGGANTYWARPGNGCDEPMKEVIRRKRITRKQLERHGAKKIMLRLQRKRTD